ncbi:MAG TPA: zinc-binding dehydrogenase, partial [Nitrolancea sp.]|nr:zinc-binding dehydrogenase [Nitrolancea sp.]
MLVAVAAAMGGWVIATAGSASTERVRAYGADVVLDYHEPNWQSEVQHLTGGVRVAVNAVRGAAESVIPVIVDGGRVATITGDPPTSVRHIQVRNMYVSPNGSDLEQVAKGFVQRGLTIPVTSVYSLLEAGDALSQVVSGGSVGGVVIDPRR